MKSFNLSDVIAIISVIIALASAIFAYVSNKISHKSNILSNRSNQISKSSLNRSINQEKNKMAMQAVQEFDNRVIFKLYNNDNESIKNANNILSYINRWSPYVNDKIANRNIILEALKPYLLYVFRSYKNLIVNLYHNNYDHISGYVQMMVYYFPRIKKEFKLGVGHND